MIRPICSYWVDIYGAPGDITAAGALIHDADFPDFTIERNTGSIHMEVTDGAIDQTEDIETLCRKIAEQFPTLNIEYREYNEEPYNADTALTWENGQLTEEYGRKLTPGELDNYTLKKCLDILSRASDIADAATAISALIET